MILYRLKCSHDHEFEAWFKDSVTFDLLQARGDITCSLCGDSKVTKAPMAPHVRGGPAQEDVHERRAREVAAKILDAVSDLRRQVEDSCEYVGDRFPEDARRIHYGEEEERGIYGEASPEEALDLREEGIEIIRIPGLPGKRKS